MPPSAGGYNDGREFRPLEVFSDPLNIYGPCPGYLSLISLVGDKALNLDPIHVWSCPIAERRSGLLVVRYVEGFEFGHLDLHAQGAHRKSKPMQMTAPLRRNDYTGSLI